MGEMMVLQPGDLGIDFSDANLDPVQIAKDGAKFVIRYSAGAGNISAKTQHKLCKPGEIAACEAAGLDFIANSEWYETRVAEGFQAGFADGTADLAFWQTHGYCKGAAIYSSLDTSPAGRLKGNRGYVRGYTKALGGYYGFGEYAGTPMLRALLLRLKLILFGWRPNAGSWSKDGLPYQPDTSTPAARAALVAQALKATPACIWQTGNYWYGKGADENIILRVPVGSHLEAKAALTPPVPVPTPQSKRHPRWAIEHIYKPAIARLRARIARLSRRRRVG